MPRTTIYPLTSQLGGAEPSVASATIMAKGRIVGVEFSGWLQEAVQTNEGFAFEVTKNVTAGGSNPIVNQQPALMREFLITAHEGVGPTTSEGFRINGQYQPLSIPVEVGDVLNLGTYATAANPAMAPHTLSGVRVLVHVYEG